MRTAKYNPAFQDPEQRKKLFAGRHHDLAEVLRVVRENSTRSQNQHLLVLGSRGMGKTTLLLRAVDEIKAHPELSGSWFAIVAPEETYRVGTIGELWLEMVFSLSRVTGDVRHERAYEALRTEHDSPGSVADDRRLADAARGYLLDFADRQKRRLVFVVENLQILLGEQLRDADAWALRETLIGEPRIMFLGSAVSSFEEIARPEAPLFEQFLLHTLEPLDTRGCLDLWQRLTGQDVPGRRMRAIEILTGGNPRLLAILGEFAGSLSLRELTGDLARLIDDHTDYLKMTTEALPAIERKVFVTLAEIWDYASAAEVATQSRVELNTASAQLGRLVSRGAVTSRPRGRGKQYRVAERLYSIYHMMRRRGGAAARARAATEFMVAYYEMPDLASRVQSIAEEALALSPERRLEHLLILEGLLRSKSLEVARMDLLSQLPKELGECPEAPEWLRQSLGSSRDSGLDLSKLLLPVGRVVVPKVVRDAVAGINHPPAHATVQEVVKAVRRLIEAARLLSPSGATAATLPSALVSLAGNSAADISSEKTETTAAVTQMMELIAGAPIPAGYVRDFLSAALHEQRAGVLALAKRPGEALSAVESALADYSRFVRIRVPEASPMLLHALTRLTGWLGEFGRLDESTKAASAAVELARALGDNAATPTLQSLAAALQSLAWELQKTGQRDGAAVAAREGLDILYVLEGRGVPGLELAVADSLAMQCVLFFSESDPRPFEEVLAVYRAAEDRLGQVARSQPQAFKRSHAMALIAAAIGRSGRVDHHEELTAAAGAVQSLQAAYKGGWGEAPVWLAMALAQVGRCHIAIGNNEQAERSLTEAISLDASGLPARFGRGLVLVSLGRAVDALLDLADLTSSDSEIEPRTSMATSLAIQIAAAGLVAEVLDTIRESQMARHLEPVIAALAKLSGEDVSAPAEVEEIAADIIKQIREGRPK